MEKNIKSHYHSEAVKESANIAELPTFINMTAIRFMDQLWGLIANVNPSLPYTPEYYILFL